MEKIKILIIGSGPAGCTAAIYAGRANLSPVVYEGLQPGGQLTTTSDVENFPGYPKGINGTEMMMELAEQAKRFGAEIRTREIVSLDLTKRPFTAKDDADNQIEADAVILATGASAKYLGLPDEERYRGRGVSACAVCDGFFYRGRTVAVVGGGDTACEEAAYLASLSKKVYMIVRKDYLRASEVMQKRVENTSNIEILYNCNTKSLYGDKVLEGAEVVRYKDTPQAETFNLPVDGFFLAIGHKPNTDLFASVIELDSEGYVKTEPYTSRTNVEGVFAAGDVCDPRYRQAITAAASGCKAALDAERFLQSI